MVATRRGTRVVSPAKNVSDENSGATAPTPSTRTTRHRSLMEKKHSQSEHSGDSQQDEKGDGTAPSLPASLPKRETRRSTRLLADKKQSDNTHEADVSESESCCSVASDAKATPRTRRRTVAREKPKTPKDDVSEAESCSSAISATRSQRAPRTLRKRVQTPAASDPPKSDDGDLSDAGSCSSVVSLSKVLDTRRITRSRRRTTALSAKRYPSDAESCSSSVSGLRGSVLRSSARKQTEKPVKPIPLNLEETTDPPSSPVSMRLRDRRGQTKSEPAKDARDSDECKSGPSASPWRRQAKEDAVDESDSETVPTIVYTSQDSPSSLKGTGTPCSSRTGSASSNRAVPVTRTRSKASVTQVNVTVQEDKEFEEHKPLPLQRESVVILDEKDIEDPMDSTMDTQECTMTEETAADVTLVLDPDEPAESSSHADVEILEPQSTPAPLCAVSVCDNADSPEIETQTHQEEAVDEMATAVAMDGDVAMENNEPEFVEATGAAEDQANADTLDADPEVPVPSAIEENVADVEEPVVCMKGVVVTEDADEIGTERVDETSVLLSDAENAERPSSSSHTQDDLTVAEQASKHSFTWKEMISLLDSSEDEESSDEGRSGDEEDDDSDEEMSGPDEGRSSVEVHSSRLFVIDTKPGLRPGEKYYADVKHSADKKQTRKEEAEQEEDFVDEEDDGGDDDDDDAEALFAPKKPVMHLSTSIDTGLKMKDLGGLYVSFDGKQKNLSSCVKTRNKVDEVLKKSVIVPDLEKKDAVPSYRELKRAAKLKRKLEKERSAGDGWFNMKSPELTEELKNDLKVLKMRSAMDPKRFYKKNDREGFPKYFQVGTVIDSHVDFYSSRIPKKQRKRTIVEELLADAEFRSQNKKKYQMIMNEKAARAVGKKHQKHQKHQFRKKKTNK